MVIHTATYEEKFVNAIVEIFGEDGTKVNSLRAIAFGLGLKTQDLQDVYQDSLLKSYHSAHTFNREVNERTLTSWFLKLFKNKCIDYGRRKGMKIKYVSLDICDRESDSSANFFHPRTNETPEDVATYNEERELLGKNLLRLSEGSRNILVRAYYQGQNYDQIAQDLRIPSGTVKSRLNRARKDLKQIIQSC